MEDPPRDNKSKVEDKRNGKVSKLQSQHSHPKRIENKVIILIINN
ncbi:hypothetical protein PDY_09710 [Photobacterium damselae subsp. damselae]|nr:hypothetical protein PDY_09710 [Photobacterium damselae subsp. damselae]